MIAELDDGTPPGERRELEARRAAVRYGRDDEIMTRLAFAHLGAWRARFKSWSECVKGNYFFSLPSFFCLLVLPTCTSCTAEKTVSEQDQLQVCMWSQHL